MRTQCGSADAAIRLKVEKGTPLEGKDVRALIEANEGPVGLDLAHCWMQDADLQGAILQGANLQGANLQGASLVGARLPGANLSRADLRGAFLAGADLKWADLSMTKMQGANFSEFQFIADLRGANLSEAQLQGADLFRVDLREVANLWAAQLRGANLRGAQLEDADLYDVRSLAGAHLYGAYLDRTRLRRDQLGDAVGEETGARDKRHREMSEAFEEFFSPPDEVFWLGSRPPISAQNLPKMKPDEKTFHGSTYETAAETYLNLKNNFTSIGRYEDAAWAYTKERQMKKLGYLQEWRWKRLGTWTNLFLWARNWLYELLAGYGERPWRPVVCSGLVVLLFAVVYAAGGLIDPGFDGNPKTPPRPPNFLDALTYSIGAFFTVGFNTMEPLGEIARLLTSIESALGIGLLALLIWTIGNSMTRS